MNNYLDIDLLHNDSMSNDLKYRIELCYYAKEKFDKAFFKLLDICREMTKAFNILNESLKEDWEE